MCDDVGVASVCRTYIYVMQHSFGQLKLLFQDAIQPAITDVTVNWGVSDQVCFKRLVLCSFTAYSCPLLQLRRNKQEAWLDHFLVTYRQTRQALQKRESSATRRLIMFPLFLIIPISSSMECLMAQLRISCQELLRFQVITQR